MNSLFNTPGPKPSSNKIIKPHKAMALGYEMPATKQVIKTNQKNSETGCGYVPGFNNNKSKRGMK